LIFKLLFAVSLAYRVKQRTRFGKKYVQLDERIFSLNKYYSTIFIFWPAFSCYMAKIARTT